MKELAPYIGPALALFIIIRRGFQPRRVKANRLWLYPVIITALALLTIWRGALPDLEALGIFAIAIVAGGALGWFTTQHLELTLDSATGTIMSKPTPFGTIITAGVFAARFALDIWMKGGPGGSPGLTPAQMRHGGLLVWLVDAGLLFVAARVLAQAIHMWIRTRPLLEQHAAMQVPPPPDPS